MANKDTHSGLREQKGKFDSTCAGMSKKSGRESESREREYPRENFALAGMTSRPHGAQAAVLEHGAAGRTRLCCFLLSDRASQTGNVNSPVVARTNVIRERRYTSVAVSFGNYLRVSCLFRCFSNVRVGCLSNAAWSSLRLERSVLF